MKDATPQVIRLADYQPPTHLIEDVALTFRLAPRSTRVLSHDPLPPNPARRRRAGSAAGRREADADLRRHRRRPSLSRPMLPA